MRSVPPQGDDARRPATAKPYPSWSELFAQLEKSKPGAPVVQAPPSREWRDVVADMIVGRPR